MVPAIFDGVPNLKISPLLFEITGSFVHEPNPLVDQNLDLLKSRIGAEKPDLGVCFDGDADRCMFVDEKQKTIGCDIVTALLARDFLGMPGNKGSTIVYDLRSSHVVPDEVKAAGGVPSAIAWGMLLSRKHWPRPRLFSAGSFPGTFISGIISLPTAGRSRLRDCFRFFRRSPNL